MNWKFKRNDIIVWPPDDLGDGCLPIARIINKREHSHPHYFDVPKYHVMWLDGIDVWLPRNVIEYYCTKKPGMNLQFFNLFICDGNRNE